MPYDVLGNYTPGNPTFGDTVATMSGTGASTDLLGGGTDWGAALKGAGGVVSGLGDAYSSYLTMQGANAQAKTYGEAAALAGQDVIFQQESTAIQEVQQQREAMKSIGSTRAEVGAAGLSEGSSTAADLLAMSAQQSSLAHTMIGVQGEIKATGYKEQQIAYLAEQQSAEAAAKKAEGGIFGGILQAGVAVAALALL